uniref:Uncharacterized protein n=1 Tax=viral metagenome TaxID=1070528 RepID=A0A6C0F3Z1_9ZZZZ
MGESKKIRKDMAGRFTQKQKDYIKKGNKAFDCLLKEAKANVLVRVPTRIGRKTSMYGATVITRFILLLILEFIQVQMLTKPEPFHSLYTTESHVSTEALNNVRTVLSTDPLKSKFTEVYALTAGQFKTRVSGFFTRYFDSIPDYTDPETGETINVKVLLTGIYQKLFEIVGDSKKIPGLILKNLDGVFSLINTLAEKALANSSPTISATELLGQMKGLHSQLNTEFATNPKLQEMIKTKMQKGGAVAEEPPDTNAIVCALKAMFFSSPVILVVGFIINFTTYTVGKLLEISLQKLLDAMKKNIQGVTLPQIDELLNINYAISSNAFSQLFDSMLGNKDKIGKIVSSFTGFIDALQGIIDSFIEMYNEKVPVPIKNFILSYFVKVLQLVDSLESSPQMGLEALLNIMALVNNTMSELDPGLITQFFNSMVEKITPQQMSSSSSPSYYSDDMQGGEGFPIYTANRGGKKRFRSKTRRLNGGRIDKAIRQFYQTNRVHRRTQKLY